MPSKATKRLREKYGRWRAAPAGTKVQAAASRNDRKAGKRARVGEKKRIRPSESSLPPLHPTSASMFEVRSP